MDLNDLDCAALDGPNRVRINRLMREMVGEGDDAMPDLGAFVRVIQVPLLLLLAACAAAGFFGSASEPASPPATFVGVEPAAAVSGNPPDLTY